MSLIKVQPDQQAIIKRFSGVIDAHVESVAKAKGYNSAASLASYVADPNPAWAQEAQAFVVWRSSVWTTAFNMLSTTTALPTDENVIAALPDIIWPT